MEEKKIPKGSTDTESWQEKAIMHLSVYPLKEKLWMVFVALEEMNNVYVMLLAVTCSEQR